MSSSPEQPSNVNQFNVNDQGNVNQINVSDQGNVNMIKVQICKCQWFSDQPTWAKVLEMSLFVVAATGSTVAGVVLGGDDSNGDESLPSPGKSSPTPPSMTATPSVSPTPRNAEGPPVRTPSWHPTPVPAHAPTLPMPTPSPTRWPTRSPTAPPTSQTPTPAPTSLPAVAIPPANTFVVGPALPSARTFPFAFGGGNVGATVGNDWKTSEFPGAPSGVTNAPLLFSGSFENGNWVAGGLGSCSKDGCYGALTKPFEIVHANGLTTARIIGIAFGDDSDNDDFALLAAQGQSLFTAPLTIPPFSTQVTFLTGSYENMIPGTHLLDEELSGFSLEVRPAL